MFELKLELTKFGLAGESYESRKCFNRIGKSDLPYKVIIWPFEKI